MEKDSCYNDCMSDLLKKLTGKHGFEQTAQDLVNKPDTALFKELVESDAFLFDFVKQNVAKRIGGAINNTNWQNLYEFLKFYSPSYEDVIISNLVTRANEDMTDTMLELLESGCAAEQTYAAKYFSIIKDPLSTPILRNLARTDNENLAFNCARTLAVQGDNISYDDALGRLQSGDEFEKLSAVKFLCAYGDKNAVGAIIKTMKTSSLSENIAGQIPYLEPILNLPPEDMLLVVNNIVNGLGEILPLSCVFDFELYDVFEQVIKEILRPQGALNDMGAHATVLLNAIQKFELLTDDEYLFDEDKNTQNEVRDIAKLLAGVNKKNLHVELNPDSLFIFTALEFTTDVLAVKELLKSNNQTLILKSIEILKKLNSLDESAKTIALLKVTDDNIRSIIRAL